MFLMVSNVWSQELLEGRAKEREIALKGINGAGNGGDGDVAELFAEESIYKSIITKIALFYKRNPSILEANYPELNLKDVLNTARSYDLFVTYEPLYDKDGIERTCLNKRVVRKIKRPLIVCNLSKLKDISESPKAQFVLMEHELMRLLGIVEKSPKDASQMEGFKRSKHIAGYVTKVNDYDLRVPENNEKVAKSKSAYLEKWRVRNSRKYRQNIFGSQFGSLTFGYEFESSNNTKNPELHKFMVTLSTKGVNPNVLSGSGPSDMKGHFNKTGPMSLLPIDLVLRFDRTGTSIDYEEGTETPAVKLSIDFFKAAAAKYVLEEKNVLLNFLQYHVQNSLEFNDYSKTRQVTPLDVMFEDVKVNKDGNGYIFTFRGNIAWARGKFGDRNGALADTGNVASATADMTLGAILFDSLVVEALVGGNVMGIAHLKKDNPYYASGYAGLRVSYSPHELVSIEVYYKRKMAGFKINGQSNYYDADIFGAGIRGQF